MTGLMVTPILPLYAARQLHASDPEVGFLVAAFFFASLLAKVPLGVSLRPRHWFSGLLFSVAILAVAPSFYTVANSPQALVVIRLVHGVGLALNWTTISAASTILGEGSAARAAIARFTSAVALGLVAGPTIGSLVVQVLGVNGTFIASGIISLPAFPLVLQLRRSLRESTGDLRANGLPVSPFTALMQRPAVLLPSLYFWGFSVGFGMLVTFVPLYGARTYGLAESAVAAVFAGYFSMTALVRLRLIRLILWLGMRRLALFALLNSAVALIVIGYAPHFILFLTAIAALGLSHGLIYPVTTIWVAEGTGKADRVLASAIYLTAWDLGILSAGTAGGVLLAAIGSGAMPHILAGAAVAPLLSLIPLLRRRPLQVAAGLAHTT